MRPIPQLAMVLSLGLAAAPALAQPKMSPGLWETTMNVKHDGQDNSAQMARMQAEMAKLPPEQRKMMEAMMAKQGVALGSSGAGGQTIRFCMSKEQAERSEPPADQNGNCKRETLERSGNTVRFKFTCSNPASTGVGEVNISSDKAYSMKMAVDTQGDSKRGPHRMDMQHQAKWLSADCGNLRPVGEGLQSPAKKP